MVAFVLYLRMIVVFPSWTSWVRVPLSCSPSKSGAKLAFNPSAGPEQLKFSSRLGFDSFDSDDAQTPLHKPFQFNRLAQYTRLAHGLHCH